MSESNQAPKKTKPKTQSKIHRRKNEQIPKDFSCPVQACGKEYGSYAALYTHMKNKHNQIKPPNMPNTTKIKNSHPGRPKIKKNQNEKIQEIEVPEHEHVICIICQKEECQCVESFNSEEKDKAIEIMSCEKFTNFTNEVGLLSNDEVNWVRKTEEEFVFKSPDKIREQIKQFNENNGLDSNPSTKLIEYLSFSSKYWEPQNINELYNVVYAMIAFQNYQSCIKFIMEGDYPKMQICIKKNPNEFKRLESLIRVI